MNSAHLSGETSLTPGPRDDINCSRRNRGKNSKYFARAEIVHKESGGVVYLKNIIENEHRGLDYLRKMNSETNRTCDIAPSILDGRPKRPSAKQLASVSELHKKMKPASAPPGALPAIPDEGALVETGGALSVGPNPA